MLLRVLLNIIVFFLKIITWIVSILFLIPVGVYLLLNRLFPIFTHEASFWFWSVFVTVSIIAYIVLWKPIVWIVSIVSVLAEEFD